MYSGWRKSWHIVQWVSVVIVAVNIIIIIFTKFMMSIRTSYSKWQLERPRILLSILKQINKNTTQLVFRPLFKENLCDSCLSEHSKVYVYIKKNRVKLFGRKLRFSYFYLNRYLTNKHFYDNQTPEFFILQNTYMFLI